MDTNNRQGGFELLKSFLGTIAGGLSSYNPFRRKKADDNLLNDPSNASMNFQSGETEKPSRLLNPAHPISDDVPMEGASDADSIPENLGFSGSDPTSSDFTKLYPDMEFAETRKRARLAVQSTLEDQGESSKKKQKMAAEKVDSEASEENLGETVSGSVEALDSSDEILQASDEILPGSGRNEILDASGEAPDETLDGFKQRVSAGKAKQGKRSQDLSDQPLPRKRLKASKLETPTLGVFDETSAHGNQVDDDIIIKKRLLGTKRKKADDIEAKYGMKLRALSISEEPAYNKERKPMLGMAGVLSRKRERIDDDAIMGIFDDDKKLKRTIFVGSLPLNAKREDISKEFSQYGALESLQLRLAPLLEIKPPRKGATVKGEINETLHSLNAYIVYKDEQSANAALAHNMKEFNGNHIRVNAAHPPHIVLKETCPVSYDNARSIFVGNVPFDVKDEELYQIFGLGKSSEMDVEAVSVVRDPNTGLSEGIAFVLFKTEAGMNRVLSLRRTLKLRNRVLQVSRVLATTQTDTQTERRPLPRLAKRSRDSEAEGSGSQKKQVKLSLPYEGTRATKGPQWQEKGTLRAVGRKNTISKPAKESSSAHASSSRIHAKRQVVVRKELSKSPDSLSEAKRKRIEKHQRGISRSKKIRRT